jgi:hypothetical protein
VLGRDGVLSCSCGSSESLTAVRNAGPTASVYAGNVIGGDRSWPFQGVRVMQISRPRDLGPLMFVIGLFAILFAVTLVVGGPQR